MTSCNDLSSTLKVIQFFDVVIIDEAAQARTAEAFLAISKGKK